MVGAGVDHSVSVRTGRKGNSSRLPGQLHPRVQRHDDQRVRILLCGIRQRRRLSPIPLHRAARRLGFPAQSLFGSSKTDQIPNSTGGWSSGLTEINEFDFNSGIYGAGTFGKTSKAPAISDTFTKIVGTHSLKAGFYWDTFENLQANGSDINGNYDFETWGASSTYNLTLDRLMMRPQNYDQYNSDVVPVITQHEWSIWGQDSWKATRKLTLNFGLRLDHEGQWYDKIGGTQVWDPASYVNTPNPPVDTGLLWNKISSKIPSSGWVSPLFFYNPRLGAAFDVFGTGRTVVRAGFGTYRYQVSSNDASGAMNGPLGSFDYNTSSTGGLNGFYGNGIQAGLECVVDHRRPQLELHRRPSSSPFRKA